MNIFLICFINGLYKEYRWLQSEYNKSWNNPLKYSELTPKEIKIIINKYESELHQDVTKKLKFKKTYFKRAQQSTRRSNSVPNPCNLILVPNT